jgi:hypothetical protein
VKFNLIIPLLHPLFNQACMVNAEVIQDKDDLAAGIFYETPYEGDEAPCLRVWQRR